MMFDDGGMDRSYTAGFKMFAKNHRYHLQLVHRQALEVWQLLQWSIWVMSHPTNSKQFAKI